MLASTYGQSTSWVSGGMSGTARQHSLNRLPDPHGHGSSGPGSGMGRGRDPAAFRGSPFQTARAHANAMARPRFTSPTRGESGAAYFNRRSRTQPRKSVGSAARMAIPTESGISRWNSRSGGAEFSESTGTGL